MTKPHHPDYILIFTVIALVVFGLIILTSASVVISQETFGQSYYFLKHQLLYGLLAGLIFWWLGQKIYYQTWAKLTLPLLFVSLVLLVLVFLPQIGYQYGGANRWIVLGPVSVQPAEITKLTFILYLAALLAKKKEKVADVSQGLVPFLVITVLIGILIAYQPDAGTLGIIVLTAGLIYFLAGAKISHLFVIGLLGLASFFLLIKTAAYRMDRLNVFLRPETDPQGIGYQINQALLAIGSGGLFGRGLGHSLQKWQYLPEPISDSIFAITAEELGFIGAVLLIILFIIFAWRGFKIAKNAPNVFGCLLAAGITGWLVFQALINMAAITGLIPLTGIPLPFVSYGGSAMAVSLAGIGILVNVSKYTR
ncbi:MAG: cell division protein FtsW [Candidatus Portnoybacteria bacterium RIFCSPHIGHO2_02_FULL_39_12]|uniref:Probable peptidoglycan glycosyltransferase FtsW n=1 Tax=Candidatus Portnoybacteria bacterium RIFCSPHIGHO2_12_FULL_38_9 TaxID=1801997 RepID=A0A1G2FII3_9BACT|nr:MAG: cell division protein FtsW [Candidatus Portnoybacteria bacterium RBG_13_40_8]OGZ36353.1 MAG: cell division protein FtsW [Candidatus Portnoybacteria bacterium RIFCSPHIGHO2_02_FULL_39_12]OGZ37388.1 MAG: cell division protein FtsW [Candidatus Portnoybacteria bacterium RIFCSPHIGHO2_12_FULL_38_9]OGZ39201.1 MAG: cell division protein FtsW [Candidatus Portnoybacteria bacterium RIFCSPLOWO2_01_FULL_38_39]